MRKVKKIITLCASASFYKELLEVEQQLKNLGYQVKIPKTARKMQRLGNFAVDTHKTWYTNKADYKIKKALMDAHFKKVIASDAILVINAEKKEIKGYIGGNGLMEMVLAYHYKKPIYVWSDIDSSSSFEEEIIGLGSIFINKDLSKITL